MKKGFDGEESKLQFEFYFHIKPTYVDRRDNTFKSVVVLCLPHELQSFLWGEWFTQSHREDIAQNQINMRDETLRTEWMADNLRNIEWWKDREKDSWLEFVRNWSLRSDRLRLQGLLPSNACPPAAEQHFALHLDHAEDI